MFTAWKTIGIQMAEHRTRLESENGERTITVAAAGTSASTTGGTRATSREGLRHRILLDDVRVVVGEPLTMPIADDAQRERARPTAPPRGAATAHEKRLNLVMCQNAAMPSFHPIFLPSA